jgi:hypothetical protein
VMSRRVPGFLPSTSGLHFPNEFAPEPLMRFDFGRASIPIGNAANGLCGGMVFAVHDLFRYGLPPPPDRSPPRRGTRLFRYLLGRLFASFNLPAGPLRYWLWQVLPAGDRVGVHGLAWRSIRDHWPRVRADLDARRPSPLGLVRARSINPLVLGRNHQVLAYGYDLDEAAHTLVLHVYDPNHPDDDGCALSLSVADPTRATPIDYVAGEHPVRGFFRTRYRPKDPSGIAGTP